MNVGRLEDWLEIEVVDMTTFAVSKSPVRRVPATDRILIAETADGRPRAISASCPHQAVRLAEYARHGTRPGTIVCAAHQREYDVETGECISRAVSGGPTTPLGSWPLLPCADGTWRVDGVCELGVAEPAGEGTR